MGRVARTQPSTSAEQFLGPVVAVPICGEKDFRPQILKGKEPARATKKGKEPAPATKKGKESAPATKKEKEPAPAAKKGKEPAPATKKGKESVGGITATLSATARVVMRAYVS
ncbi:hypothetical protein NDU88_003101 [Pleurodeles waltl]|uniref:Uncharacterized protein n=1 Tax=Pleurodeles waltl TaxID=8319 RepID=A0AAV7WN32_PLEWA|nr:hypothetical protein NDU88_003101 [Pleurodeles waltl]